MMIQMEYCSGNTLDTYLKKRNQNGNSAFATEEGGVIDREQNLEIFSQIVKGMAEIHRNKIMHRDLKPENIFIDVSDASKARAIIGDFGLARMLASSSESTQFESPRKHH